MEDEMKDEEGGLVQRLRESPRTVSALIIILIVAAAIYAFSGRDEQEEPLEASDESVAVAVDEEAAQEEDAADDAATTEEMTEPTGDAAGAVTSPTQTVPPAQTTSPTPAVELPEPSRTESGFVEVAQAGDGVTHLGRRAAAKWLQENQVDYEVTQEHLIYIEDYIKNKVGREPLSLGEEKMINYDLVAEAVGSAKNLTESQLNNLSQYTYVLS